jgi:uncharacterized protein YggT (Ycf19 family)
MGDNERQVIRNEETVVAGQPEQTTVRQTETSATDGMVAATPVAPVGSVASQDTVRTTTASEAPSDRMVQRNVAEQVVDPAADKAAGVGWFNNFVWFIVGILAILLLIRFVLLATGANESTGFAQLIYGLTGWMVAPFAGLFGSNITYPGSAGTGVIEFESIVAIVVVVLLGWIITKLAQLALGTNRTTGTVHSETQHKTKV